MNSPDWSGDCTGSGACSVTMTADMSVTANFTAIEYTLTITSEHGTVAKNPDQVTYHYGGCGAVDGYTYLPLHIHWLDRGSDRQYQS